jgi:septum site-determining protein MinD
MDMVKRGDMMSTDDVVDILAVNLIGVVPDDERIVVATNQGEPLVGDDSLAGTAYMNICHRILGEEVPFLDLNVNESFWKKLGNLFKKN